MSKGSARPFDVAWARSIVAQCRAAGVACFVKQLGANVQCGDSHFPFPAPARYIHSEEPIYGVRLGNRKGGDMAEWPEDLRVRQFPEVRSRKERAG